MLLSGLTPNTPAIQETSSQAANAAITHDRVGRRRGWNRRRAIQKAKVSSMIDRANKALPTTKGKRMFDPTTRGVVSTRQTPILTIHSRRAPGSEGGCGGAAPSFPTVAPSAGERAFSGLTPRRSRCRDMKRQQVIMATGRRPDGLR